jgi:hypothetical protein
MPFEPAPDVVARGHALPPPFACSCTNGGLDAACVRLGGELDLRGARGIDSCGMHAVVGAGGRARQAGRRPVLVRAPSGSHFGSHFGACVSPTSSEMSGYRHDPVDRGARKGSTSWRP